MSRRLFRWLLAGEKTKRFASGHPSEKWFSEGNLKRLAVTACQGWAQPIFAGENA